MVIQLVIGLNIAIALGGFVLAWRLWQLRRTLVSATVALDQIEAEARLALRPDQAPTQLLQGRDALVQARTRYRRLRQQLQQLQQIFAASVMMIRFVRSVRGPSRSPRQR